jgi:hypothetical protein
VATELTAATPDPKPPAKTTARVTTMGERGINFETMGDLYRFAEAVFNGGFAPKGMNIEGCFVAAQMGLEIGLTPMQAIQSIAPINNRPAVWGDAVIGLVIASGLCEGAIKEWYECQGKKLVNADGIPRNPSLAEIKDDTCTACFQVQRKGDDAPYVCMFSVGEAKLASLWGKAGPWTTYPARMIRWRARGFGLRDKFPDVLKGIITREEADDIVAVIDHQPAPAQRSKALREKLADGATKTTPPPALTDETLKQQTTKLPETNGHAEPVQEAKVIEPKLETLFAPAADQKTAPPPAKAEAMDPQILISEFEERIDAARKLSETAKINEDLVEAREQLGEKAYTRLSEGNDMRHMQIQGEQREAAKPAQVRRK